MLNTMPDKYNKLSEMLFLKIPEVHTLYLQQIFLEEEDLKMPHIIYGDLLNPYLIALLKKNEDEEKI